MNWQEVCEHPSLQDLPFKIETNERGEIVMAPVKVYHSAYQGEIGFLLRSLRNDGKVLAECAISTAKGTKVADVAWASEERFQQIKDETECSIAPEIWSKCFHLVIRMTRSKRNERSILTAGRRKSGFVKRTTTFISTLLRDGSSSRYSSLSSRST